MSDPVPTDRPLPMWPAGAPEAKGAAPADCPTLTPYLLDAQRAIRLGLATGLPGVGQWPDLCATWLLQQGFGPQAG